MTTHAQTRLLQEAEFVERYTQYYRRQLTAAMQKSANDPTGLRCIRICLEALDVMHGTGQTMVEALGQSTPRK